MAGAPSCRTQKTPDLEETAMTAKLYQARACSCRIESQNSQGPVNGRVLAALIRLGAEPCRRHILRTFACGLSHASKAGLRDVRQPSSSTSAQVRQSNG